MRLAQHPWADFQGLAILTELSWTCFLPKQKLCIVCSETQSIEACHMGSFLLQAQLKSLTLIWIWQHLGTSSKVCPSFPSSPSAGLQQLSASKDSRAGWWQCPLILEEVGSEPTFVLILSQMLNWKMREFNGAIWVKDAFKEVTKSVTSSKHSPLGTRLRERESRKQKMLSHHHHHLQESIIK